MNTDFKKQPVGSYLIIGSGRLATHLAHYFSLLHVHFEKWNRKDSSLRLQDLLLSKPTVLLAISDSALETFFKNNNLETLKVIHFSGAYHSENMISCHPLMTFGQDLYSLEVYKKIFFAVTGIKTLQEAFPFLPNPSFQLQAKDKPLYHALCVLSAAGAQKIWNQSEQMLFKMGVPDGAFSLYIKQIAENYINSGSQALTGPWARGDEKTISQNLNALSMKSDSLCKVYGILKEGHHDNS
jgi:hypothetical protein